MSISQKSVNLSSNNGWNNITWLIKDILQSRYGCLFLVEVIIVGTNWNIVDAIKIDSQYIKATDYSIVLSQMLFYESKVKTLNDKITKWLKTPIELLPKKPIKINMELCGVDAQSLVIKFGTKDDQLINIGHTECSISYKLNRLKGECKFITDITCIQNFIDEQYYLFNKY